MSLKKTLRDLPGFSRIPKSTRQQTVHVDRKTNFCLEVRMRTVSRDEHGQIGWKEGRNVSGVSMNIK